MSAATNDVKRVKAEPLVYLLMSHDGTGNLPDPRVKMNHPFLAGELELYSK